MMNQRVLDEFTDALQEENESAFRRATSSRFENIALRSDTSFRDLEILDLPTGKLSVIESEDLDDSHRKVTVSEEGGRKYQMQLVHDVRKNRWVVDDVMIRQDGRGGTRSTKSATEIMDLLLTLREFLETMKSADRQQILAMTDTEFQAPLESLPDAWLHTLISDVTSQYEGERVRRPEAQLNGGEAVVKMPAENGFILIQIVRRGENWLIRDVEVHNRREEDHPGSIRNQALALASVAKFLRSYNATDRASLQSMSTADFFETSLRVGDYRMMPLPDPDTVASDFQIRAFGGQTTLLMPTAENTYRFDLERTIVDSEVETTADVMRPADERLVIAGITIYDRRTQQQRTLSSTFTAPARATLFMEALHNGDLRMLRQLSTQSMNNVTWAVLEPEIVDLISLAGVPDGAMQVQQTQVRGLVTTIELVAETGQLLSVSMQDEAGTLSVNDVSFPHPTAGILSLKDYVALQAPIASLAAAWQDRDRAGLQRASSMDFNRLVWANVQNLPVSLAQVPLLLLSPIHEVDLSAERATVQLDAGGDQPVVVRLLKEQSAWVVDEVSVPGQQQQFVNIRESLRNAIARKILHAPAGAIETVNHELIEYAGAESDRDVYGTAPRSTDTGPVNFTMAPPSRRTARPAPRRLESPVHTADYVLPQPPQESIMRFGPGDVSAGSAQSPMSSPNSSMTGTIPRSTPTPTQLAPMKEIDGVVYFGAPAASAPSEKQPAVTAERPAPAATQGAAASVITDPSQHPIAIPGQ